MAANKNTLFLDSVGGTSDADFIYNILLNGDERGFDLRTSQNLYNTSDDASSSSTLDSS